MDKELLITIDGPAGAGKSSISKVISQKLSYFYLDTGALYRAIAYKIKKEDIDVNDIQSIVEVSAKLDLHLEPSRGIVKVILDNIDISKELRSEEIGFMASRLSAFPIIRNVLMPIQQEFGKLGGVVAEGRDMGTVVFPHADLKFFLQATALERAKRRQKELVESGVPCELDVVKKQMELRDKQDSERSISPLKIPADAVVIDSTLFNFEQVVAMMMSVINTFQK
ncbi:MAG: Cytidylate kinase [Syntrophus sp. PtaB.Bin001]|nr:MAG: Cytidylate kinase [Syntrophus sp. PtaB.Bin001]